MGYAQLSYDPWETTPEERKARFVGREALLQRVLEAIAAQPEHQTIQHYLLLGPRGIGKTTLLLTLRDRIRGDASLSARWFCVQFREEEYFVRTLRDLLELTLGALAEEEELPEAAEMARRVREEPREDRSLAAAVDALRALASRHGKRILLLVDNFDRVFPATSTGRGKKHSPENEFRRFRKLLSTETFLMVVGASVRLFQEIATYDRAFFNFFSPVEVPDLSEDEIWELLRRCAEAEGNTGFLAQFQAMRDKVRAITFMTGGNPRLVVMLYDVLRHHEMTPVVQALRETVGGLTPLLKHVLDDMPRQQSKTLDALVRLRGADSPKRIAEMARLPLNVVTAQLGRLKESRFVVVEGEGKGKPATYRISDPMFQTWYQMRYLRGAGRRVELFVEFIRAWFSVEERREFLNERWSVLRDGGKRGGAYQEAGLAIQYYAAALEDQRERRDHFERLADVFAEAGREREAAMLLTESIDTAGLTNKRCESEGYRLLGTRILEKGDTKKAIAAFRAALRKEPGNVEAVLSLGECLAAAGERKLAVTEFERVIKMRGTSVEQVTRALFNRGLAMGVLGDKQGEIADYTTLVEFPGAPTEWVAMALVNRGFEKGVLGDNDGAIADFTAVVDLPGAPTEGVARAFFSRGFAKGVRGDSHGEIADYTAVVALPGAPAEQVAVALVNRGLTKQSLGDWQGEIADCTMVVELPGAPARLVAMALVNRAAAKGVLGDGRGEIADCTAVVDLAGAPAEQVARALVNRGLTLQSLGDNEGAIADFTAVVDLPGASAEGVARALVNRGFAQGVLGDRQGEIADSTAVVGLAGAPAEQVAIVLVNRGVAKGVLWDWLGEIADYTAVVDLAGAPAEQVAIALVNRGVAKGVLGDKQGETADYTAVVGLAGAPAEQVARALVNRGATKRSLGDNNGAIADYTTVADLPGVPAEQVAEALFSRGFVKGVLGDNEGEIADYTAVVELAGAPAERVATSLFNRGLAKGVHGDNEGAIADYTAVVEMPDAPAERVAMALFNRAVTKRSRGDNEGAVADYTTVVELAGAPAEQVARALANRGGAFRNAGAIDSALRDYQTAIDIPGVSLEVRSQALIGSGAVLTALGKVAEAMVRFEQALELRASTASVYAAFNGLVTTHLQSNRVDEAARWMSRLHEYESAGAPIEQRLEVRINAILTAGRESGAETAELLLDAALRGGPDDIRARLEFLAPAIQYAKTGDEKALARLPEREFAAAKKIAAALLERRVAADKED